MSTNTYRAVAAVVFVALMAASGTIPSDAVAGQIAHRADGTADGFVRLGTVPSRGGFIGGASLHDHRISTLETEQSCSDREAHGMSPSTQNVVPDDSVGFSVLSYYGGDNLDSAFGAARDEAGFIYIGGTTSSQDLPGLQTTIDGPEDSFLAKLTPDGQDVVFVKLLGGGDLDDLFVMTPPKDGAIWMAGVTLSADFPVIGSVQSRPAGLADVFVSKVDTESGDLLYSTYLGGSEDDYPGGIAVDGRGRCIVSGQTNSRDFPLVRPIRSQYKGGLEAFVTRVTPGADEFDFSTYIGGSKKEYARTCAVDQNDNIVVCGATTSSDFPVKGAVQDGLAGPEDAFVVRIAETGDRFLSSTYLGGERIDGADGVCLDADGYVYVGGFTNSRAFPLRNAVQGAYGRGGDAYIAKLDPQCRRLVYSTYFGGSGQDAVGSIAIGSDGAPVVGGLTGSADLPVVHPAQASFGGGFTDGFVVKLGASGQRVEYATYVGGQADDFVYVSASPSAGEVILGGFTFGEGLPVVNALQDQLGGAGRQSRRDGIFGWIVDPAGFQLSLENATADVSPGDFLVVQVAVARDSSVTDPITISIPDERSAPIRSVEPIVLTGSSGQLHLKVRQSARSGEYMLVVAAEDPLGRSQVTTLRLVVHGA